MLVSKVSFESRRCTGLTDFQLKWLLPPLLGAVIGYITNWIAIRMLFRPYKEYRIWKWKIPFTPGLLAARRQEIAVKIGGVISEELINERELTKSFDDPGFLQLYSETWIKLRNFFNNKTMTLGEALEFLLGRELFMALRLKVMDYIDSLLLRLPFLVKEKDWGEKLSQLLYSFTGKRLVNVGELLLGVLESSDNDEIKAIWEEVYINQLRQLQKEEISLAQLLGQERLAKLRSFVVSNQDTIGALAKTLLSYEGLPDLIVPWVQSLMKKHWSSRFLANLLSEEGLKDIVKNQLLHMAADLETPKTKEALLLQVLSLFDSLALMPLYQIGFAVDGSFGPANLHKTLKSFARFLVSQEREILEQEVINSTQQEIEEGEADFSFSQNLLLEITAKPHILKAKVEALADFLLSFPLPLRVLNQIVPQSVEAELLTMVKGRASEILPVVLKTMDISKTVERRLNEFPLDRLEELTLSVVGRELKAITQLGALLGFIIGAFQLLVK